MSSMYGYIFYGWGGILLMDLKAQHRTVESIGTIEAKNTRAGDYKISGWITILTLLLAGALVFCLIFRKAISARLRKK